MDPSAKSEVDRDQKQLELKEYKLDVKEFGHLEVRNREDYRNRRVRYDIIEIESPLDRVASCVGF